MKVLKIVLIVLSFTSVIVVVYKILTKSENLSPLSQIESVPTPSILPTIMPTARDILEKEKVATTVSPTPDITPTPIPLERVRRMNRELEDDDD